MPEMVLQSEDILHTVGYDRGNTMLQGMESETTLGNRLQTAGDTCIRHLLKQFDKHSIQCPSMKWTLLAGEEKACSIIDSHSKVGFETGAVRQRRFPAMLHKRLRGFEAALESPHSDGPVPNVDVRQHQWWNCWTVLGGNCRGTAGTFAHSKTVIESQGQNAPGTWIRLSRDFKKFLYFIHLEVNAAIHLSCLLLLIDNHE